MAASRVRSFESLLTSKLRSADRRKDLYKNLITALVKHERIETTLTRCKDLSRVAERMIDLAKKGDEETIYSWLTKKELVPKVFGVFLLRYQDVNSGYTTVYRLPPRQTDSAKMAIVEFNGNSLPPLLPPEDELRRLKLEKLREKMKKEIPLDGTPV